MKKHYIQNYYKIASFLFIGVISIYGSYSKSQELNSNLKEKSINTEIKKEPLMPMPIGDFDSAILKVNIDRNPFQEPSKSEIIKISSLYKTIKFKGLAQSGNQLHAIIEISDIQKFYKEGDKLDNGFQIQSISYEDVTVDITNGTKNYRLTLNKLR
tara:strand:- start:657 stop:1124 length:468 start_codon:yes stop_codon:yes gene_type:complete